MKKITVDNFENQILNSHKPFLLLFKRDGCHLCLGMIPIFFRLSKLYGDRIRVGYVESETEEELLDMFYIEGVPTVFFFVDGDGEEIEYPDNPSPFSGYTEKYLIEYLEKFFHRE